MGFPGKGAAQPATSAGREGRDPLPASAPAATQDPSQARWNALLQSAASCRPFRALDGSLRVAQNQETGCEALGGPGNERRTRKRRSTPGTSIAPCQRPQKGESEAPKSRITVPEKDCQLDLAPRRGWSHCTERHSRRASTQSPPRLTAMQLSHTQDGATIASLAARCPTPAWRHAPHQLALPFLKMAAVAFSRAGVPIKAGKPARPPFP